MTTFRKIALLFLLPSALIAQAQTDSIAPVKKNYPQFQFKGLFQARYSSGLSEGVDLNGLHHSEGEVTRNSFEVKRMRVQVRTIIGDRTEVVALVNLAEFKSDPKNKVLENAYIKYSFSKAVSFTLGQFRPWFGIEETYPVDIIRSMDFSNQYYEFGKLGWTSFQTGISMTGTLNTSYFPVTYAVSVMNGNGRNQIMDSDNGKHYSSRVVLGLSEKYNINFGINGGIGEVNKKQVHAYGFDLTADYKFSERLILESQFVAKQAINQNIYFAIPEVERKNALSDYQLRGFHVLPNLRYEIKYKKLSAIEFSCRYEYIDTNYKVNSNSRQTILPMFGLEFLKDYGARIQLGMQIDIYKHNIPNSTTYDNNLLVLQVQSRL
ncbi:porin [Flavobacterium sp. NKUCC04_CG]|uniref:porin n=1 Tax=Flavobacterium sp. NKUCC04_CG TaxID=2842121 RepID=UPI001C5BCE77|nr:porin [Flavobacterium sp. NKUCC04_CG]MBW3519120.1 OprO/OprP family phosphate-selective porin [Flavobacterium sp. NKUCC04_CG]